MAVGTVIKYNGLEKQIAADANRQWDDATAGNIIFCLCTNAYTPSQSHSTTADLAGLITAGDGAPIAATNLAIDSTTTAGTTYFDSDEAYFGGSVSITAKYLIAVMPVVANTFSATTSKLLFYVDLDNSSGTASKTSTASVFAVYPAANGWFKMV